MMMKMTKKTKTSSRPRVAMTVAVMLLVLMLTVEGTLALRTAATTTADDASISIHYHRDLQQQQQQDPTNTTTSSDDGTTNNNKSKELTASILSNVFLFFLIFGLSATVEMRNMKQQLTNRFALGCGVAMQYLIMPVLGFIAVVFLRDYGLEHAVGLSLLVVTSSPGGSYSNWWCSTFNAELALSVAMTTVSSLLSVAMLPLNLFLYTYLAYGGASASNGEESIVQAIDFKSLFISLAIVMSAICSGLYCGYRWDNATFHAWANRGGSVAGILLIVFGLFLGSAGGGDSKLWNQNAAFYVAVSFPFFVGMFLANILSRSLRLSRPETVAIAIECCYQNTGIATSVAITMFDDPTERAQAIAVPLFYGVVEAVAICIYCLWAWKVGWTKAPPNENFCVVVTKSYEVVEQQEEEGEGPENADMVIAPGGGDQDVSLVSSDMTRFSNEQIQVSEEGIAVVPNNNSNNINMTTRSSLDTNTTTFMSDSMDTSASDHDKKKNKNKSTGKSTPEGSGNNSNGDDGATNGSRTFWSRIIPTFLRPRTHSSSTASESYAPEDNDQQQPQRNRQQQGNDSSLRSRLVSDYTAETAASTGNNNNQSPPTPSLPEEAPPRDEEAIRATCASHTTDGNTSVAAAADARDLTIPPLLPSEKATSDALSSSQQKDGDEHEPSAAASPQGNDDEGSMGPTAGPRPDESQEQPPMDRQLSGGAWFM